MNAGTDNGVIGDVVKKVKIIDENLNFTDLSGDNIDFGYRSAPQLQNQVIYECLFRFQIGDSAKLMEIRAAQLKIRKEKQPLDHPSCGSVFKRPPGNFAGKLIEEAGLKGLIYGNAQVSAKHAGFIINLGSAKASDIKYLIDKIEAVVYNKFDILLEPEVRFLGF